MLLFTDQEDTSVDEDAVLNLTLIASDADNDDLIYSAGAINMFLVRLMAQH